MKIKPEQLLSNLKQQLQPLYWINGDEPLLLQECADQIRLYCREQDFQDREIFSIDGKFNWSHFTQATSNLSLFADKKLIELRLASPRLEDAGKQALQGYLAAPNPDYVVLITSGRIEPGTLNTKWYKTLDKTMVMAQVWPLSVSELPVWLNRRLLSNGISASPDALQILVDKVEGNLLAAVQEIEKLVLISKTDDTESIDLDAETVAELVTDSSKYTAIALIDAALGGNSQRALKILHGLHAQATQPLMILGAVSAELRRLLPMLHKVKSGQSVSNVVQSSRVNFKRVPTITSALKRLQPGAIYGLLDQARQVDYAVKGLSQSDPWIELEHLLLRLSGVVSASSVKSA
jgi:DNA polymerase-3 subunit delta